MTVIADGSIATCPSSASPGRLHSVLREAEWERKRESEAGLEVEFLWPQCSLAQAPQNTGERGSSDLGDLGSLLLSCLHQPAMRPRCPVGPVGIPPPGGTEGQPEPAQCGPGSGAHFLAEAALVLCNLTMRPSLTNACTKKEERSQNLKQPNFTARGTREKNKLNPK